MQAEKMHRMDHARAMPERAGSSALAQVGLKATPLPIAGACRTDHPSDDATLLATSRHALISAHASLQSAPPHPSILCACVFEASLIVSKPPGSPRKLQPTKSEKRWYAQLEIRQTALEFELGVCEGNPHHATNVIPAFSVAGSAEGVGTLNGRCATSQCSRGGLAAAPL